MMMMMMTIIIYSSAVDVPGTLRALTVKDHGFRVLTQYTGRLADVGAEVTLRHVHDDEVERDGILGLAIDLYPIPSGYRLDLDRN